MGPRQGVAIDLGSVNTRMHVAGHGIVVAEPSAIALSRPGGQVVVAGLGADGLTGKEPQDVEVIHPVRDGVIADLDATAAMLQAFWSRAVPGRYLGAAPALVCLPADATGVQRQSVRAAVHALRPRLSVRLVAQSVAAAAGAGFDLAAGAGAFVVQVGGGTTEVAVLAGTHVVRTQTLHLGGNAIDDAITAAVRKEYGLLIGRNAARGLKTSVGLATRTGAGAGIGGPDAEAVGVDAARRTPRTERIAPDLIAAAIEPAADMITNAVRELLSDIPPDLAAEVVRSKIRLSGGGALLPGLAHLVEAAADIATVVVEDPLDCAVRGMAVLLEDSSAQWLPVFG